MPSIVARILAPINDAREARAPRAPAIMAEQKARFVPT